LFQLIYADYANEAYLYNKIHFEIFPQKLGWDGTRLIPFQNLFRNPHPPFKGATVAKNREKFNC
jgi:hypothetical protein